MMKGLECEILDDQGCLAGLVPIRRIPFRRIPFRRIPIRRIPIRRILIWPNPISPKTQYITIVLKGSKRRKYFLT